MTEFEIVKKVRNSKVLQFFLCLAFLTACFVSPFLIETVTEEQAESTRDFVEKSAKEATVGSIFGNNAMIAMFTLLPIIGVPWIGRIIYNTGVVFVAFKPNMLLVLLHPIVWIEFCAYSYALLQSLWITFLFLKKRFKDVLVYAKTAVFWIFALLFFGAVLEKLMLG